MADLLLGWHLSHADTHADHLPSLDSHGAGALTAAASPDTHGGVEGGDRGVFGTGAPGARLPVVHCAGMLVTVANLLEGAAVWAQDTTWRNRNHTSAIKINQSITLMLRHTVYN